jgi:hypothetical protein
LPVVVGGRAAGSEAVQRVLQPASGAGALDAFSDAIAASPPARVAHESSAEAMVRAAGRGRRLREAIAETAARLARNEVDAMRAALGTPA